MNNQNGKTLSRKPTIYDIKYFLRNEKTNSFGCKILEESPFFSRKTMRFLNQTLKNNFRVEKTTAENVYKVVSFTKEFSNEHYFRRITQVSDQGIEHTSHYIKISKEEMF